MRVPEVRNIHQRLIEALRASKGILRRPLLALRAAITVICLLLIAGTASAQTAAPPMPLLPQGIGGPSDWTSPQGLASTLLELGERLPMKHAILPSMLGSMALQQCLKMGCIRYRLMSFEKTG